MTGCPAGCDCMVQNIGCLHSELPPIILKRSPIPELRIADDGFAFAAQGKPFVGQVVRAGKVFQGHSSGFPTCNSSRCSAVASCRPRAGGSIF